MPSPCAALVPFLPPLLPSAAPLETSRVAPTLDPPRGSLTLLLHAWRQGSGTAFGTLIDQVYDQLRALTAKRLHQIGNFITLSPTELIHEALLGVMQAPREFENRVHFFATMSLAVRSILVDHARARSAGKRGGGLLRVTLSNVVLGEAGTIVDLLAIEEALTQLEKLDPRCGQILHLTCFTGLTRGEIAGMLGLSVPTVDRELHFARAWIKRALSRDV
jgi:RNA polymerase sigma factor (TIGR02999 family)